MQALTEQDIKKVALKFLRQTYRFRFRNDDQPVTTGLDMQGKGGILVDGYYSFQQTDGSRFLATFEATSMDSFDEIKFRQQSQILFWDGLASSCILIFFLSTVQYFNPFLDDEWNTAMGRISLILFTMAIYGLLFYIAARKLRRYRYIYAVEQFKRYHADEQWIAYGEDIFTDSADPYLKELKNQCILNGFGLIMVTVGQEARVLATPSRKDIFQGKRKKVSFIPLTPQKNTDPAERILSAQKAPEKHLSGTGSSILRFQKRYTTQLLVSVLCIMFASFLMIWESQRSDYQRIRKSTYQSQVAISRSAGKTESPVVKGDTALTIDMINPALDELNRNLWNPADRKRKKEQPDSRRPGFSTSGQMAADSVTGGGITGISSGESVVYDCARFYTHSQEIFIVEEGIYLSWLAASDRIRLLHKNGIESGALLLSCFLPGQTGISVYLGAMFSSREEASKYIEDLADRSTKVIQNARELQIRKLPPPKEKADH